MAPIGFRIVAFIGDVRAFCMQTMKALMRLCGMHRMSEPPLLAYDTSTCNTISYRCGPFSQNYTTIGQIFF